MPTELELGTVLVECEERDGDHVVLLNGETIYEAMNRRDAHLFLAQLKAWLLLHGAKHTDNQ